MSALRDNATRAFRHRDFRLLWAGAFLSFSGSWVQNVAQGWLVFRLTGSEQKLAMVTFFWALPVALFGIFAGSFTDSLNKQVSLVLCQIGMAMLALFLAAATHFGFVEYWHILAVSFLNGCISCIEMPTRQSMVSEVVPEEDLSAAIPLNAMTFNIARIVGPWFGAILLARIGPQACYLFNALSFLALVFSVMAIRYTFPERPVRERSVMDLVLEGARYTFREPRLRTLFAMEGVASFFGMAYIPLMPAIAERQLRLDKVGLGHCFAAVGIGAMTALVLMTSLADKPWKGRIVGGAMFTIGASLAVLGFTRNPYVAYGLFFLLGMCTLAQFNTTNTLFQVLAPEKLRGRVLAMHIWAMNGLGPVGLLFFGWLASQQYLADRYMASFPSVAFSLVVQGSCVVLGAVVAFGHRKNLAGI